MLRALVAVGFVTFGASIAMAADTVALPLAFTALVLIVVGIGNSYQATRLHPLAPLFLGAPSEGSSRLTSREPANTVVHLVLLEQPRR